MANIEKEAQQAVERFVTDDDFQAEVMKRLMLRFKQDPEIMAVLKRLKDK